MIERLGNSIHLKTMYLSPARARIIAIQLLQMAEAVEFAPVPIAPTPPAPSPPKRRIGDSPMYFEDPLPILPGA